MVHTLLELIRERTVATLVSLGGASGALTDPTPEFPSGKTPADLASINGHKGISGFLAESSLTTHLSNLTLKVGLKDVNELDSGGENAIQTVTQGNAVFHGDGGVPEGLSLKDSLAAVCNATQAAARIHQVFRIQSFQRKQVIEYEGNNYDISDEQAISLIAIKPNKPGKNDLLVNSAAIRIQKKFRGWKGRKEFLIMRKRIVKIQVSFCLLS